MTEEEPLKTGKALYAAGAAQSLSDTVLDRFLTTLAVASGASVGEVGAITGVKMLFLNLPQVLFGQASDRWGKRRLIAAGRLLNAAALAILVFVDSPAWLIPLVAAESFFLAMITPAWSSLLGDYTREDNRGTLIGRINSVAMLGGFTAMIIALVVSLTQSGPMTRGSFTPILLLASASSLAAAAAVLMTREKPPSRRHGSEWGAVLRDPALRRFLTVNVVFNLLSATTMPLFSFITVGRLQMTVWQVAFSAVLNLACNVLSQRPLGALMDRVGRKQVLAFSRAGVAASCFTYAFATSWLQIVAVEAFIGVCLAAWVSGQTTYIIDVAPQRLRGTYIAASMTSVGIASFIGSNLGGYVVQTFLSSSGYEGISLGLLAGGVFRLTLGLLYLTLLEDPRHT